MVGRVVDVTPCLGGLALWEGGELAGRGRVEESGWGPATG